MQKNPVLNPIQKFIVILIAEGLTVKKIANKLGLTVGTIYVYRAQAKKKLSLDNDVQILRYALKNNLIQL